MKITLVNPPISLEDVYGRFRKLASFQPPVGLASLAGYLLPHGHEVQIIDCNALGISVTFWGCTLFLTTIHALRGWLRE